MLSPRIAIFWLSASLFTLPAAAEPPSGSYALTVDGDSVVRLFQGGRNDTTGPECTDGQLPSGEPVCAPAYGYTNVQQSQVWASYRLYYGGALYDRIDFDFWGTLRASGKGMRAKLSVKLEGARTIDDVTTWLSGGGKVACRDDLTGAWEFTCTGKLAYCSSSEYGVEGTCEPRLFSFVFPEVRAPWRLELDLETDAAGKVRGQARAVLPTEDTRAIYYEAVGKYSSKTDTVSLKIRTDSGRPLSKLGLSKLRIADGRIVAGRLKYKLVGGQSGTFEIGAPAPD